MKLETVCFYHPAVWWLSGRLRQEREHCCDELAAQAVDSRAAYGRALLALEELRGQPPLLAMGATGGSLVKRIQRLTATQPRDRTGAGGMLGVILVATTIVGVCIGSASQADGVSGTSPQAADTAPDLATAEKSDDQHEAGVVQGTLIKAADGSPVGEARVILRSGKTYYGNSDANGRFRLRNIPPSERQYEIWAQSGNLVAPKVQIDQKLSEDSKTASFRVQIGFSRDRSPDEPQGTFDSNWGNPGLTFDSKEGKFLISPLQPGMPLEMTVLADGYDKFVVARVVADTAKTSKPISVELMQANLAQRSTLSGEIIDHAGYPVSGAQLRLIVSTDRPNGPSDNNFNWVLIKNGQLGQKPYCDQFMSNTTDSDGRFEFRNVSPGKHLQLAYWGPGVPQGRKMDFDETRAAATDSVTITLPRPARIRGSVDRTRFPTAGSIRIELAGDAWHQYKLELKANQSEFAFDDLPAGEYKIYVAAKPEEFKENGATFYRIATLANQTLQLKPGDAADVKF